MPHGVGHYRNSDMTTELPSEWEGEPREFEIVTVAEIALRLGCTDLTVYRLLRKGRIPHYRVTDAWNPARGGERSSGYKWLVPRWPFERWFAGETEVWEEV